MIAWAVDRADGLDRLSWGPTEAAADAGLHAEIHNITAAWDAATRRGDIDARIAIAVSLDNLRMYRGLAGLATWALDLADDPALASHPRRLEALGAAAGSAWLTGEFDRADALAAEVLVPGGQRRRAAPGARRRWRPCASTGASRRRPRSCGRRPPGW